MVRSAGRIGVDELNVSDPPHHSTLLKSKPNVFRTKHGDVARVV